MAARHLYGAFSRIAHPGVYVKLLADDPAALRRLVTVLGGSAFIGEAVAARPELVDLVLFRAGKVQADDARTEVAQTCSQDVGDNDVERQAGLLRRAKVRVTTQVALDDLAGEIDTREATSTLAALADSSLEAATRFALTGSTEKEIQGLSVIAMGKLGGCDIGYGSDLDVIFLFEPTDEIVDPVAHYSRKARRIIQLISMPHYEGPGYELDTRLRPSGNQGLLVVSLDAFARYHQSPYANDANAESGVLRGGRAATWERLALLRARAAAGDIALGSKAIHIAQQAAYESPGDFGQLASDIHHLRSRMERELAQERPGRYDLKFGSGGLVDIEFSVQLLQLKHGADPRVRNTDTLKALAALRSISALSAGQADTLREGYLFLRQVEQRIRIVHGDSTHLLEESAHGLPALARRLQIRDVPRATAGTILLERYRAITTRVRACYDQLVVAATQSAVSQTED
jgi:glutamate-ammonia-ligase adenylyltransferase